MKILAVGDLHAYPWPVFPPTQTGQPGYLAMVEHFLTRVLPDTAQAEGMGENDMIVLLGDLADEPYRRGKIAVQTMNTLARGLVGLTKFPGRIEVLAGNHDRTGDGPGQHWFGALPRYGRLRYHADKPGLVERDGAPPIALVPYTATERIEAWLTELPERSLVLGHFVYRGTRMDNGKPFDEAAVVPGRLSSRFSGSILGHAHVPQEVNPTLCVHCAGTPLPYSWASDHAGSVLLVTLDDCPDAQVTVRRLEVAGAPRFLGPWAAVEVERRVRQLRTGGNYFVRVRVAPGDVTSLPALREAFPALHLVPVLDDAQLDSTQAAPRLDLAQSGFTAGAVNTSEVAAALRSFVAYQVGQTNAGLPGSADELVALGMEVLGLAPKEGGADADATPADS